MNGTGWVRMHGRGANEWRRPRVLLPRCVHWHLCPPRLVPWRLRHGACCCSALGRAGGPGSRERACAGRAASPGPRGGRTVRVEELHPPPRSRPAAVGRGGVRGGRVVEVVVGGPELVRAAVARERLLRPGRQRRQPQPLARRRATGGGGPAGRRAVEGVEGGEGATQGLSQGGRVPNLPQAPFGAEIPRVGWRDLAVLAARPGSLAIAIWQFSAPRSGKCKMNAAPSKKRDLAGRCL